MSQPATNIAEHLSLMAARYPEKPAVILAGAASEAWTFRELNAEVDRLCRGLERAGVRRGMRTILLVRPGREFFALTFALFRVGAVPVMIDPGMGKKNLVGCLARVRAEAFIGIPLAHVLRLLKPAAFRTVHIVVTVGRRWAWGGLRYEDLRVDSPEPYGLAETRPDDPAAILFTTGSTGPPKGVVYTHAMFDAQVRYLHSHYGYTADEIDLPTFPLFALFDAALGMTAVVPDMDFTRPGEVDPRAIIGAIERFGCTHMFGSPALLRRVGRFGERAGVKLPTLKRVITAGAPVGPDVLRSFGSMLTAAGAAIHTPYGATEALPVADIASGEILGETAEKTARGAGVCVGRPLAGMEVRIIRIDDGPIAEWSDALAVAAGEIGEICVKGPVVTREYFGDPAATALHKMREGKGCGVEREEGERGEAIWHRMGDVGYFDEDGRLWFCGRKAHRVVMEGGQTLFTVPCEAIFNQHPKVLRTALVGVGGRHGRRGRNGQSPQPSTVEPNPQTLTPTLDTLPPTPSPRGQTPVLCVELESEHAGGDRRAVERELLEMGAANPITKDIGAILFHPRFPVDIRHNAKIFRERLREWADGELRRKR